MDDPTLSRIEDITEEEANITMPEVLPSSSGRTTSSSEFSAFAARLQRHRRGRKRLSRCREEISASSRSNHSEQTAADTSGTADSDNDSLASCDVFGSKDDQISFFKQTLVDMNKKLEAYQEINADLSRKLENCKVENKGLKKQIQDILWDKYVLYDKYKKLKERFGIVDSPSGDDDSPGSNNSGPSGAGRVATPVRRPRKRGDSPAGPRDGAGPSKKRTVLRCGLDRQMESDSNASGDQNESRDSGMDVSHSAGMNTIPNFSESEDDGWSCGSVSQRHLPCSAVDQDNGSKPDDGSDGHSKNDVVPSHVSLSEVVDDDSDHVILDADESSMEADNLRMKENVNEEEEEEDDVNNTDTLSDRRIFDSEADVGEECHEQSDEDDESFESEKVPNGQEVDDKSNKSSTSSSTTSSGKRPRRSTSTSSEGESGGSKRRKSSSPSTDSSQTSHSDTSGRSSVRSLPVRLNRSPSRSQSRSPSPQLPFRDSPGVIPGAPMPAGTRKLPRYWHRDGNDVRRRCSKGKKRGAFRMDGAFTWMAGDSWTALVPFLYRSIYLLFLLAYNLIL